MKKIMKRISDKGFVHVAVVVVLALVVLGGAGYLVWNRNNASEDISSSEVATEDTEMVADEFLLVTEWGIKISLRDAAKVQYKITDNLDLYLATHPDQVFESVLDPTFKSEFLLDETCTPGLSLYRTKTLTDPNALDYVKKIGAYYYYITGGPGACSPDPDNNPDDQLKGRFVNDFDIDNVTALK